MPVKLMAGLAGSSAVSHTFNTVLRSTCPPDDHLQVLKFKLNGPGFQKLVLPRSRALPPGCLNDRPRAWLPILAPNIWAHDHEISSPRSPDMVHTHETCLFSPFFCRWADGNPSTQLYLNVMHMMRVAYRRRDPFSLRTTGRWWASITTGTCLDVHEYTPP